MRGSVAGTIIVADSPLVVLERDGETLVSLTLAEVQLLILALATACASAADVLKTGNSTLLVQGMGFRKRQHIVGKKSLESSEVLRMTCLASR